MPESQSTAVVPAEERELRGLELAERHFPMERREQVAAFLEVPADSPALLPYLAWCAAHNFSPVAGHVWLIPKKMKAKDGEPERTIYKPAVGRDGLLHKARESKGKPGGYRGLTFDVVCERDTFEVERSIDPMQPPKVLHRYATKPTEFPDGEAPDRYRGRVIGAWACCYVDGEPPTFYFANLREHGRLRQVWDWNPGDRKRMPLYLDAEGSRTWAEFGEGGLRNRPVQEWEGAWDYLSTMILKAAQSYVLRIALGVTGVVPVDELRSVDELTGRAGGDEPSFGPEARLPSFDFAKLDVPEELRERLRHVVEAANEQDEFAWPPAKCEMVFSGRSADELAAIVERIELENDLRDQRAARASGEEEHVVDAEIVEEEPRSTEWVEKTEALKHRLADLLAAKDSAEGGSDEMSQITAEMDQVVEELRGLGLDPRDLDL